MKTTPTDRQAMLKTLDELSKTVDVMSHVISRLHEHVENLTQQRTELVEDATMAPAVPPPSIH